MLKVVLKPKNEKIEGSIEVKVPSDKGRRRMLGELALKYKVTSDGTDEEKIQAADRLDELVNEHVSNVNIKLETGEVFSSYYEMQEDSELDELCKRAQEIVINGSLGEA